MRRVIVGNNIWISPTKEVAKAHFGFFPDGDIIWYTHGHGDTHKIVRIV